METKKSKVLKVVHNTNQYNGNNGIIYYHEITFDNGDKGKYGSKDETCKKFVENQESEYTIETKINGQYTNYVIKPVQPANGGNASGFKGQPKDDGMIIAQSSLASACQYYQQRQPMNGEDDIFKLAERMIAFVKKNSTLNPK